MAIPDPATTEWVPIWNPLSQGPVGPTGPAGATGPQGIPGNAVPHHVTHETGGVDAITAISGGIITTGTVADARLSTNVPLKNVNNVFTVSQTLQAADAGIYSIDPSRPVDGRRFQIINSGGFYYIQATNDINTINQGYARISRDGSIYTSGNVNSGFGYYERGRGPAMGEWQTWTPTWAQYGGGNGGVIGNGSLTGRYTMIGKTVIFTIRLNPGTTTTFGASYWAFTLPVTAASTDIIGSATARSGTTGQTFVGQTVSGAALLSIASSVAVIMHSPSLTYDAYISNTLPFTWAAGDQMWISGFYEI